MGDPIPRARPRDGPRPPILPRGFPSAGSRAGRAWPAGHGVSRVTHPDLPAQRALAEFPDFPERDESGNVPYYGSDPVESW
jgi:hypothetical protein